MQDKSLIPFSDHYHRIYGDEWPELLQFLQNHSGKIGRPNGWAVPQPDSCKLFDRKEPDQPAESENSMLDFYNMDKASALIPSLLDIKPGQSVLDMCAAPGGKSLIIWELMNSSGKLVLNDISQSRRYKLKNVLNSYIPRDRQAGIQLMGMDACKLGLRFSNFYDRVLLDAPCSSEAHVVRSVKALSDWSPSKSKQLSLRQFSLICSGLASLKVGGLLAYSTCSISPLENDGVITKLLKRKKHPCELVALNTHLGSETETGRIFLPHRHHMGPIFCSILRKL